MPDVAPTAGHRGPGGHAGPDRRVVVGFDGSPDSAAALPLAALDAALSASTLQVVVADDAAGTGAATAGATATTDLLSRADEEVRRAVPGLHSTGTVVAGDPASALLSAAEQADLVAVGARGVGHEFAPAWCEVAVELTARAKGPVLVVRSGDTGAADGPGTALLDAPAAWPSRVVVVLTGRSSDEVVLRTGTDFAWRHGAPVHQVALGTAGSPAPALSPADVLVTRIDGPAAVTGLVPGSEAQVEAARALCTVLAVPAGMDPRSPSSPGEVAAQGTEPGARAPSGSRPVPVGRTSR